MDIKKKVAELKEKILEVKLNDHLVDEDKKVYRLHFLDYHGLGEGYGDYGNGIADWSMQPFFLPDGLKREEGLKVLSYLKDFIKNNTNIKNNNLQIVRILNSALDLEEMKFKRLESLINVDDSQIVDLFIIYGNIRKFKRSKYYKRYFNWYTSNISEEEVSEIYDNIGINFPNLIFKNEKVGLLESVCKNEETKEQKFDVLAVPYRRGFVVASEKTEDFMKQSSQSEIQKRIKENNLRDEEPVNILVKKLKK